MTRTPTDMIEIHAGHAEPIRLHRASAQLIAERSGPDGVEGLEANQRVSDAAIRPEDGPPLTAHVVEGDQVVVAVGGDVPQDQAVIDAVVSMISAGGTPADQIEVLRLWSNRLQPVVASASTTIFDPTSEPDSSYLMADEAANPRYIARALVDADVVIAIGSFAWDAALGGRSIEGELWPAFSRKTASHDLTRGLAMRPRGEHRRWQQTAQEVLWQLGVIAELRAVPGRGGSLAHVAFGMPAAVTAAARRAAQAWRPSLAQAAEVTVASLSDPSAGLESVVRAAAAASRVTYPDGTVCVASRLREEPGIVFSRWRQGVAVEPLVREAIRSGDTALIHDAFLTRQLSRALGSRRLVLASDLEEATVESLDIGHAASAEDVVRLCTNAESLIVLHEADRMLPRLA